MLNNYSTALITGGSSGIGLQLALLMAQDELDLYLVSENNEQLKQARESILFHHPHCNIQLMCYDLSDKNNVMDMCNEIDENGWELDIVVNNAGFATWGNLLDISREREVSMMNLMINGTYHITRHFLERMVLNNHGCIVNIASIAAFQPNPTLATYGAAKAWVYYWTRSISEELKSQKSNVQCIAICPTPVRTNFQQAAQMTDSKLFDSPFTVDPEDVAEGIIKAIKRKKERMVPVKWLEWTQKITARLPESFRIWIGKQMLAHKDD